jgi:imidazoleglycerol-phosphate dehydratase
LSDDRASAPRTGLIERITRETEIRLRLDLDGAGKASVTTGVGFFDHMLELFAHHGRFDLEVEARGDLSTGSHHTVEDVGIALGSAVADALGDKSGITRYGSVHLPMDEALVLVSLDLSGRPFLAYDVPVAAVEIGGFESELTVEFFQALAANARLTLHVRMLAGTNQHHIIEAVFKGFGRALGMAVAHDEGRAGVPSTKGTL